MSALQCPSAAEPAAGSSPPAAGELGGLAARVAGQDVAQLDGNALVDYRQDWLRRLGWPRQGHHPSANKSSRR